MHYPKLFNGLFRPLTHHQPLIEYYSHFPLSFILIIFRASCFSFFQGPFDYLFLLLTASLSLSFSPLGPLSVTFFYQFGVTEMTLASRAFRSQSQSAEGRPHLRGFGERGRGGGSLWMKLFMASLRCHAIDQRRNDRLKRESTAKLQHFAINMKFIALP